MFISLCEPSASQLSHNIGPVLLHPIPSIMVNSPILMVCWCDDDTKVANLSFSIKWPAKTTGTLQFEVRSEYGAFEALIESYKENG